MKENRLQTILHNLEEQGLEQMLITDPITIFYLTGRMIQPWERFYGLYISARGDHRVFINQLEVVPEDLGVPKLRFTDADPYLDLVYEAVDHKKPLGVDKNMAARFLLPLMERKAATGFVNASLAADKARAVKDEEEIHLMRKASQINDQAMGVFKNLIREGISEREVGEQMKKIYLELGAEGYSFEPLVAFGASAAAGHHYPADTKLKDGDCVLFDVGCTYQGYCSDMTRTFFFRGVSEHQRKIYELVKRANETAEAAIRPGMPLSEIDGVARSLITKAGYGDKFTHRLGHFIGLETHDFGDVSAASPELAVPGNIFSIEPGVYLEGDLGVRIEDLVLVTEGGIERFNHYPKDLEIL